MVMNEKFIAVMLKTKRKELNLSIQAVLDQLHNYGINISGKTLYGWESGHRQPDADTFLVLCKLYGIDSISGIDQILPFKQKNPPISGEAENLARDFDSLDNWGKKLVRSLVDIELARCKEEADTRPRWEKPVTEWSEADIDAEVADYRRQLLEEKRQAEGEPPSGDVKGTT